MNLKRYDETVMTYQQALEHIRFDLGRAILYTHELRNEIPTSRRNEEKGG